MVTMELPYDAMLVNEPLYERLALVSTVRAKLDPFERDCWRSGLHDHGAGMAGECHVSPKIRRCHEVADEALKVYAS